MVGAGFNSAAGLNMQQYRKTGLVLVVVLLLCLCFGFVLAKSAPIVGMVTETQGFAYWQNDSKKNRVQELAELPENAKLVLTKDSKLTVVYLASGQQYALTGPGLVQFKNTKPIAMNGMPPKTIGATPVLTEKTKIDPKSVQTAAQTLVSTEAKEDPNLPVAVAAPSPPPPSAPMPPRMIAPSPASASGAATDAIAAAEARARMEAYEAAKQSAEAEMMAARHAETGESVAREPEIAAQEAARRAAEAAAAKSRQTECKPEKDKETSGTSTEKIPTDCPPAIIEQRN